MTDHQDLDTLVEQLADIEHQRWADWQRYCNKVLRARATDERTLEERLQYWDKQINTPYSMLSEREKEEDRKQVRRYLPIVESLITLEVEKSYDKGYKDCDKKWCLSGRTPRGEPLRYFKECLELETDDCILWKYTIANTGYGQFYYNGRYTLVHPIALMLKVGEHPKDKPMALHSCRNRNCFNYRHLRWGDNAENQADRVKDGTNNVPRGPRHNLCKLSYKQVLSIFEDTRTHQAIAKDYGVSSGTVSKIKIGMLWNWLTGAKQ